MTARSSLLLAVVVLAVSSVARVRADDPAEDDTEAGYNHFERGVEYVHDGDLKAALIEFKRAYAASPNYRVLYNLGQVCNELREYTDASAYFRRYLADGAGEIDPARKREVESMLAKLTRRTANLMLSSNIDGAEIFVDDVSVGKTPLNDTVRVSAGARSLSAAVSGRPRINRTVEAAGGDTLVVKLDFPLNSATEAPPGPHATAAHAKGESTGPGAALWLGIGAGALGIATGVMAYLASQDASKYHDAVKGKTTARQLQDLDDRATAKALVTDILLGATVVTTGVTLIVAFSGNSERETAPSHGATSSPRVSLGPAALAVSGTF